MNFCFILWQMLSHFDVIFNYFIDRCYIMADVIAIVADVIATALQIGLYCNGS